MEQENQDLKKIIQAILPTKAEIIVLIIFSLGFLLLVTSLDYFKAVDSSGFETAAHNIEITVRIGLTYLDRYIGVGPLTLVFWMLVGTIVYSIIWVIASTYSTYKDDVPTTKGFVMPRGYKKSQAIHEAIAKISMRTASVIMLIFWLYILLTKTVPYTIELFTSVSLDNIPITILHTATSVILLASSIFVVFILSRFSLLRPRIFYK